MVNVGAKIWENIISVNIYIYIYIYGILLHVLVTVLNIEEVLLKIQWLRVAKL